MARAIPRFFHLTWRDRRIGAAVAAAVAALAGLLTALAIPRGPTTATQALIIMAAGLAVGLLAGLALRSRWAMLLTPVAHMVALEVGRLDAVGPTVDMIRLNAEQLPLTYTAQDGRIEYRSSFCAVCSCPCPYEEVRHVLREAAPAGGRPPCAD